MVKCPKCKIEIEELKAYSGIVQTFYIKDKKIKVSGLDYLDGWISFECPECLEELFKTKQEAEEFLKTKLKENK